MQQHTKNVKEKINKKEKKHSETERSRRTASNLYSDYKSVEDSQFPPCILDLNSTNVEGVRLLTGVTDTVGVLNFDPELVPGGGGGKVNNYINNSCQMFSSTWSQE